MPIPQTSTEPSWALPGRELPLEVRNEHFVLHRPIKPPFPEGLESVLFGMGCFWGAERLFWSMSGVFTTAAGYAGGITPNPSYEEVCTGRTGHAEVVLVVYDPLVLNFSKLLEVFWESHDPTQGMRQGNDTGTQYRSAIYVDGNRLQDVRTSLERYGARLAANDRSQITTEIRDGQRLYYAETYHQQYLAKNPHGYCGLAGTGVCFAD